MFGVLNPWILLALAAAFAAELGIAASTDDYEAVLADPTIDAVYIATPFATHHDLAARALRAGKHALVEKPIALDASQAADLFRIAREEGRFLAEAMWMKWNPAFRRLHQELAAGRIGEARSLRAHFALPFPPGNGSRLDPARSGSTLLDQGIYPVTLAHSVFGMPESVHARGVVAVMRPRRKSNAAPSSAQNAASSSASRRWLSASGTDQTIELRPSASGRKASVAPGRKRCQAGASCARSIACACASCACMRA